MRCNENLSRVASRLALICPESSFLGVEGVSRHASGRLHRPGSWVVLCLLAYRIYIALRFCIFGQMERFLFALD